MAPRIRRTAIEHHIPRELSHIVGAIRTGHPWATTDDSIDSQVPITQIADKSTTHRDECGKGGRADIAQRSPQVRVCRSSRWIDARCDGWHRSDRRCSIRSCWGLSGRGERWHTPQTRFSDGIGDKPGGLLGCSGKFGRHQRRARRSVGRERSWSTRDVLPTFRPRTLKESRPPDRRLCALQHAGLTALGP